MPATGHPPSSESQHRWGRVEATCSGGTRCHAGVQVFEGAVRPVGRWGPDSHSILPRPPAPCPCWASAALSSLPTGCAAPGGHALGSPVSCRARWPAPRPRSGTGNPAVSPVCPRRPSCVCTIASGGWGSPCSPTTHAHPSAWAQALPLAQARDRRGPHWMSWSYSSPVRSEQVSLRLL